MEVDNSRSVTLRALWVKLEPVLVLLVFVIAISALFRETNEYHYHEIRQSLRGYSLSHLGMAGLLALGGYAVLTIYDYLGLRYAGRPLSYRRSALASLISYGLSHTLGFGYLTGTAVRYRLYGSWGLAAGDIARVIAFVWTTFLLGLCVLGGLALLLMPDAFAAFPAGAHMAMRPLGALMLLVVAGYWGMAAGHRGELAYRHWTIAIPSLPVAVLQTLVSCLDWTLAGAVLYALLPPPLLPFGHFVGIFMLAQVAGLISHVPGGLGIFETVMVLLLAPAMRGPDVLAALVMYRLIYYLIPFAIASMLLVGVEVKQHRTLVLGVAEKVRTGGLSLVPMAAASITFAAGLILLISGATPGIHSRLHALSLVVPLPVLELSHFLASLIGVGLLILARGLLHRVNAAYYLALLLLGSGAAFSMLKGLDWEEATALLVMLIILLPTRRHFYRRAAILGPWSAEWAVAITLVVCGTLWLGVFAHKHVAYSSELWWRFAADADAPRFLRMAVAIVILLVLVGTWQLMRPGRPRTHPPTTEELDEARRIALASPDTLANLALLGDKSFLFSESRNSFIMYGVSGRVLVALGDPVGPAEEQTEMAWRFREECDRLAAYPAFYLVSARTLPIYLDLGLDLLKLGEEARVPLGGFCIEDLPKSLRRSCHRLQKELTFELRQPEEVAPLLPELRAISDAWLTHKSTREKRFSLGRFDERYLSSFPVALLKQAGRTLAFANVWASGGKEELSVDLMRYVDDAPSGLMDHLFVQVMLWGRANHYAMFNLGMAPLAGVESRRLSPLWNRLGSAVYRHGELFYNFQGLRSFKQKFNPLWEPRYLAAPRGVAIPLILPSIAALISGGGGGIWRR